MGFRRTICLGVLVVLAACATPTTNKPTYTQDELRAEEEAQSKAAMSAPLYFDAKKPYGYKQLDALDTRLKPVAERVRQAASQLCQDLQKDEPPPEEPDENNSCSFTISMDIHKRDLNAYAHGHIAVIYPAMVDFLKSDDQLAFILSHEMAHDVMHHSDKKRHNAYFGAAIGLLADIAAGAENVNSKGTFGNTGERAAVNAYSPQFEAEADYVGLYIMARAGYNIDKAPDVWRIMSATNPDAIYVTTTHPNNSARTIAMTKTVAEIHAKQRAHQPLIPNIQA